jgi:hypothetical protein
VSKLLNVEFNELKNVMESVISMLLQLFSFFSFGKIPLFNKKESMSQTHELFRCGKSSKV